MRDELDEKKVKELAILVKEGDNTAFSILYELTITMVYRTTSLLLKSHGDTSDVVQEIYLQLFNGIKKYDTNRPFKLWLLGVVYRQVSAFNRKRWLSFRLHEKMSSYLLPESGSLMMQQYNIEEKEQLQQLLNRLPNKQRQVVVFKYYHDLSQEAIAHILEIPVGTVKSRLNSALKTLRGEYTQGFQLNELRSAE